MRTRPPAPSTPASPSAAPPHLRQRPNTGPIVTTLAHIHTTSPETGTVNADAIASSSALPVAKIRDMNWQFDPYWDPQNRKDISQDLQPHFQHLLRPSGEVGVSYLSPGKEKNLRATIMTASFRNGGVNWSHEFRRYSRGLRQRTGSNGYELNIECFNKVIRSAARISVSQLCDADVARVFNHVDYEGTGLVAAIDFVTWLKGIGMYLKGAITGGEEFSGGGVGGAGGGGDDRSEKRAQHGAKGRRADSYSNERGTRKDHLGPRQRVVRGAGKKQFPENGGNPLSSNISSKTSVAFGRHSSSLGSTGSRRWHKQRHQKQKQRIRSDHGDHTPPKTPASGHLHLLQGDRKEEKQLSPLSKSTDGTTARLRSPTTDRRLLKMANVAQRKAVSASKVARAQAARADECYRRLRKIRAMSLGLIASSCNRRILTRILRKWHSWYLRQLTERAAFRARHRVRAEATRADVCIERLRIVQATSIAVIQAYQRRRKIARLLRIWHTWYLRRRNRTNYRRTRQRMTLLKVWSSWRRYLDQRRFEKLHGQYAFLTALQDRHIVVETRRTLARAIAASSRGMLRMAWRTEKE